MSVFSIYGWPLSDIVSLSYLDFGNQHISLENWLLVCETKEKHHLCFLSCFIWRPSPEYRFNKIAIHAALHWLSVSYKIHFKLLSVVPLKLWKYSLQSHISVPNPLTTWGVAISLLIDMLDGFLQWNTIVFLMSALLIESTPVFKLHWKWFTCITHYFMERQETLYILKYFRF